jgi:alpha-tubulin suppressor-like RCC1 family protein
MTVANNNISYNYGGIINFDQNIPTWNNTLYRLDATNQNLTILMPPICGPSNNFDPGRVAFQRTDSLSGRVVTITYGASGSYVVPVTNDIIEFVVILDAANPVADNDVTVRRLSSTAVGFTLTGDVTAPLPTSGSSATTVALVGGKTAAAVAQSVTDTVAATSANTVSTLVKRDASGNFSVGTVSANKLTTATTASANTDVPSYGQVLTLVTQSRVNIQSVITLASSNQNTAATNYIGLSIGGRVLASGDRLALTAQTTQTENGVWVVQAGGGIARSSDCASGIDGNGFVFGVIYGTYANNFYRIAPVSPATTAKFGVDSVSITLYFSTQNVQADGTTLKLTGNVMSTFNGGVGVQPSTAASGYLLTGYNSAGVAQVSPISGVGGGAFVGGTNTVPAGNTGSGNTNYNPVHIYAIPANTLVNIGDYIVAEYLLSTPTNLDYFNFFITFANNSLNTGTILYDKMNITTRTTISLTAVNTVLITAELSANNTGQTALSTAFGSFSVNTSVAQTILAMVAADNPGEMVVQSSKWHFYPASGSTGVYGADETSLHFNSSNNRFSLIPANLADFANVNKTSGSDTLGDGYSKPYASIAAANTAKGSANNKVIRLLGSNTYIENLNFSTGNITGKFSLISEGSADGAQTNVLNGTVAIGTGTSSLNFQGIQFNQAVTVTAQTSSVIAFKDCYFNSTLTFSGTWNGGEFNFDKCTSNSTITIGGTVSGSTTYFYWKNSYNTNTFSITAANAIIHIYDCEIVNIYVTSAAVGTQVFVRNCQSVTIYQHDNGSISVKDSTYTFINNSTSSNGYLEVINSMSRNANHTYYAVNKTGTCPFFCQNYDFSLTSSTVTGYDNSSSVAIHPSSASTGQAVTGVTEDGILLYGTVATSSSITGAYIGGSNGTAIVSPSGSVAAPQNYTIPANVLVNNGDTLHAEFTIEFTVATNSYSISFAGITLINGANVAIGTGLFVVKITRVSAILFNFAVVYNSNTFGNNLGNRGANQACNFLAATSLIAQVSSPAAGSATIRDSNWRYEPAQGVIIPASTVSIPQFSKSTPGNAIRGAMFIYKQNVFQMGWNWGGPFGSGYGGGSYVPTIVPMNTSVAITGWLDVVYNDDYAMALTTDGRVFEWGWGQLGSNVGNLVVFPNSAVIAQIYSTHTPRYAYGNHYHSSYAVDVNGAVYAWHTNNWGQLGINSTTDQATPQLVTALNGKVITKMSVSGSWGVHVGAIDSTGQLWMWGFGANGAIGTGSTADVKVPTAISGFTNVIDLVCTGGIAGPSQSFTVNMTRVLKADGTTWACGYNNYGQLADGTQTQRNSFVQENQSRVNTAMIWGGDVYSGVMSSVATSSGLLYCAGLGWNGSFGDNSADGTVHTSLSANATLAAAGFQGKMSNTTGIKPKVVSGGDSQSSYNYTFVLDNTGTLYASGYNAGGQLGTGVPVATATVGQYARCLMPSGSQPVIDVIAIGGNNVDQGALAILADGSIVACGINTQGGLPYEAYPLNYGHIYFSYIIGHEPNTVYVPNSTNVRNMTAILDHVAAPGIISGSASPGTVVSSWSATYTGSGGRLQVVADLTAFSTVLANLNYYLLRDGVVVKTNFFTPNVSNNHQVFPSLQYFMISESGTHTWSINLGSNVTINANDRATITIMEY